MEKIQSKVIPPNQPSLQDWLKEFNKPLISSTNLVKHPGSVVVKNN